MCVPARLAAQTVFLLLLLLVVWCEFPMLLIACPVAACVCSWAVMPVSCERLCAWRRVVARRVCAMLIACCVLRVRL